MSAPHDATAWTMSPLRTCTSARSECTAWNAPRITRRAKPARLSNSWTGNTNASEGARRGFLVRARPPRSGHLRPRWHAVETHASSQLQKPGTRTGHTHDAPAEHACQRCEKHASRQQAAHRKQAASPDTECAPSRVRAVMCGCCCQRSIRACPRERPQPRAGCGERCSRAGVYWPCAPTPAASPRERPLVPRSRSTSPQTEIVIAAR